MAQRALVVESNLFEPWQDKDEKEFRWGAYGCLWWGACGCLWCCAR